MKSLRKFLFEGLIVVIPLYLTYRFAKWALSYVYGFFHFSIAFLPVEYRQILPIEILVSILTALVVIVFIFISGVFVRTFAGRAIRNFISRIIENIPIVNSIYTAFSDLFELTVSQEGVKFSSVVYVANPNKRTLSIGFVTGQSIPEIAGKKKKTYLNVFIPGTPNPTSGFLICVPEKEVMKSDLSIEQGMKIVVSGGVVHR